MADPKTSTIEQSGPKELRLFGTATSRGIATGRIVRLFGTGHQFVHRKIDAADIPTEKDRFRSALNIATNQLNTLIDGKNGLPEIASEILHTHLLVLEDPHFADDVETEISNRLVTAQWAVRMVCERLADRLERSEDVSLKERMVDIEDISGRILNLMSDEIEQLSDKLNDAIIAASYIRPSTLAEFVQQRPLGIITEHGGWTSHAFIMAREMGIPAVTGLKDILRTVADGDCVMVDGFTGSVIVNPTTESMDMRVPFDQQRRAVARSRQLSHGSPKTLDGREIVIRANAENLDSVRGLSACGASGIGLVRSEYLFAGRRPNFPAEEDQIKAYRAMIDAASPNIVRFRTFDQNVESPGFQRYKGESNPALGLRAIRVGLLDESVFRTQVRAILRSAGNQRSDIILPLVTGVDEIIKAKEMLAQEYDALLSSGSEAAMPNLGVMIEVPSAVVMIEEILGVADLICIGSNDLVQYLLAVDRENEMVADFYQTLHPAVTRSIHNVLTAAERANVPAMICGEMAGSPFYTPVLLGLGSRELSMNINAMEAVRTVIEGISYDEARELALTIVSAPTAGDAEDKLRAYYSDKWPHLFSSEMLETIHHQNFHQ